MSIVKEEHKATLRKWHEELQEKRGERASLRRSTTVNDVCLTDGFRLFLKNRQIKWQDEPEWRITALALIAAVSANVKAIDERQPFAAQLAAVMSKGRFTRLSAVKTPDELLSKWNKEIWLFARQDFDERVFTNPYEPVDLERVMTARKKYFTTSAEKQSAKAAREKKQEAAE